jgi:transposase-like protein
MTNYNSLLQVAQYFSDEKVCRNHIEKMRWTNGVICPFCNHTKIYRTNRGFKCAEVSCHKKFTVTVGTFLENTKISLSKWMVALYLTTAHKKGISSCQLARDIKVTQRTAWFMLQRIRSMVAKHAPTMLRGRIEADETFIGAPEKNKHKSKQTPNTQGRSTITKAVVFGMKQRSSGKVIAFPVAGTSAEDLMPPVYYFVAKNSIVYTDEWWPYTALQKDFRHEVIRHGAREFVRGDVHTNGMENFWSLLKRGILGIYHHVSKKHLHRYVTEFVFRYNTREITNGMRIDFAILNSSGRLTYNDLIGKVKSED